jgi:hypothetical protein
LWSRRSRVQPPSLTLMKDGSYCPTFYKGRTGYPVRPLLSAHLPVSGTVNGRNRNEAQAL